MPIKTLGFMKRMLVTVPALMAALSGPASAQLNTLSEVEKAEGFQLLFDGTLQSFKNNFVDYKKNGIDIDSLSSTWKINDTTEAIITGTNTNYIRSKMQYADFDWRMDYRNAGNAGLPYRFNLNYPMPRESGVEVAIDNLTEACKFCPGAAYDIYPPVGNAYKMFATGEWNSIRIVAIQDSVEHWLNGVKVVGFRYHSPDFWARFNESMWNSDNTTSMKVPGNREGGYLESGYIGFQADHGGNWNIRNLRISTTNLSFGPMKTALPIGIGAAAEVVSQLSYSVAREASGGLSLSFRDPSVLGASLVSLDGKSVLAGRLAEGGSKVSFAAPYPGVYVLQVRTAVGTFARKLSLM